MLVARAVRFLDVEHDQGGPLGRREPKPADYLIDPRLEGPREIGLHRERHLIGRPETLDCGFASHPPKIGSCLPSLLFRGHPDRLPAPPSSLGLDRAEGIMEK